MNSPTAIDKQEFFDRTLQLYKDQNSKAEAAGIAKPYEDLPILTESSLRFEQFISAATTTYNFPVNDGQVTPGATSVLPNEIRLQQNDNFHIDRTGFYIAVTAASTDTAFRLQTEANEIFLGSAAIALNYQNLWAGNMNISVNQKLVLTNHRLSKYYFTGQTQRLSAAANQNFSQIDMSSDALIPMRPSIMLSGRLTNLVTIQLNAAVTSALAANNSRIVLIYDGLRAQNASIAKGGM